MLVVHQVNGRTFSSCHCLFLSVILSDFLSIPDNFSLVAWVSHVLHVHAALFYGKRYEHGGQG